MNLSSADRKKLDAMLDQLAKAVEDLLLTGLTTASETTRQTLNVAFQEASRLKLLRLGSTLRVANEELGRFTRNDADFSRSRFSFFLNRAWMLGKGLARALKADDDAAFDLLNWTPTQVPIKKLDVVTLGVAKKVAANAFVAFDFRLRLTQKSGDMKEGARLAWSCIFPIKPGMDLPPEAFLHLPQKQKFTAFQFLEGNTLTLENVAIAIDDAGGGRISLGEQSTVVSGPAFTDWAKYLSWDAGAALKRVEAHEPGPFDLDVEMQEEVLLHDWTIDKDAEYSITSRGVVFSAPVSPNIEGKALRKHLDEMVKKKDRPPLFGLLHYEKCRLLLQPLTLFRKDGPAHLMISQEKIDRKELLKALKF